MADVRVNELDLETLSHSLDEAMQFAVDVIGCLSQSGDHGSRQGLAIVEAIGQLDMALLPALVNVIQSINSHSASALELAKIVSTTESGVVSNVRAAHGRAESELGAADQVTGVRL
ncbi:hypothetical protein [Gordonia sp. (in: high G+C Gram-positive bacteria)]|uniref:hypothetical protein n=1 Tax=Gordonia sp. (in: high G+C Gram-positive bacteria) TaxID=84139 RepID=UPI003C78AA03